MLLESRDRYFTNLRNTIESMVRRNGRPAIVIAHSLGGNVFTYFIEWIKRSLPDCWQLWFDLHISTYFSLGAPFLGAPSALRGLVSIH